MNEKLPLNKFYSVLSLLGFALVSSLIINLNQLFKIATTSQSNITTLLLFFTVSSFLGLYIGFRFNKNLQQKLLWLLIIVACLQTIFLSRVFIFNFFPVYFFYISDNTFWGLFVLLFCFSLLLFFQLQALTLIFYRLTHGVVIPEYFSAALFYLGSGCFVGIIFTTLITLNFLNLNWAVFINICMVLLALLFLVESFMNDLIQISFAAAIVLICYALNLKPIAYATLATTTIPLNSMELLKTNQTNYTNQINYGTLLQQFLFNDLKLRGQAILVLGDSRLLRDFGNTENYITYLNVDANSKLSACAYFDLLVKGEKLQKKDAVLKRKYDVIISDLPQNQPQVLNQILNYDYLSNLKQSLAMHGIAIFNVNKNYEINYGKSISTVFVNCEVISLNRAANNADVYVCQRS